MKNFIHYVFSIFSVSLITISAFASTQSGYVTTLSAYHGTTAASSSVYFFLSNTASSGTVPNCGNNPPYYWVINNADADTAKTQISMLMAAQAQGRIVTIIGTGSCLRATGGNQGGEVVQYLLLNN